MYIHVNTGTNVTAKASNIAPTTALCSGTLACGMNNIISIINRQCKFHQCQKQVPLTLLNRCTCINVGETTQVSDHYMQFTCGCKHQETAMLIHCVVSTHTHTHTLTSRIFPEASEIAYSLGKLVDVPCAVRPSIRCRTEGPTSCKEAGGNVVRCTGRQELEHALGNTARVVRMSARASYSPPKQL